MKPVQKPFNLVEAHKHELNKKDPNPQIGENGEELPIDDRAMTEIQKLLYGKANLAEIIVQVGKIENMMPKITNMRKDVDFVMR